MPLQQGETFIGSWEPYILEPFRSNYEDFNQVRTPEGIFSVITEDITPRQFPIFSGKPNEVPNPFAGDYDRFDYEEIQYQRTIGYGYIITYEDGTTFVDAILANSYSYAPDDMPLIMPRPTLSPITDLPAGLHKQYANGGREIPIISIEWTMEAVGTVLKFLDPPLFLPGSNGNGGRTVYRPFSTWLHPHQIDEGNLESLDTILITPTKINFYRKADKPTYYDLLRGYKLDGRTIPNSPEITVSEQKSITVGYYRENKLEPIPELRSIDWLTYKCDIPANTPYILPIVDCVLGTLDISDSDIANEINSLATPSGNYPFKYYFGTNLAELFDSWYALWNPNNTVPALDAAGNGIIETRILRKLGANNNYWNNRPSETPDLNVEPNHPMFIVDEERAFDWHLSPQSEGIGTLIMDSPRTIESLAYLLELRQALQLQDYQVEDLTSDPPVHYLDWYIKNSGGEKLNKIYKALGAELWGTNPDDPKVARVDNLGWRIKRLSEVLGIRVTTEGKIDENLEKTSNRRVHLSGDAENNIQEYNPNCFGSKGMLLRVVPNKFSRKGTEAGGYSKIVDIPQMLAELHEQADSAMGYQEGTAIEINIDGKTYRYPNQLALLTELLITAKQTATYSKGAFFSSLISEQSIKEVMGGLGLRTVDKFLEFNVAGKTAKLYYKGISASQSIRRKLSAVATNVGIAIGNII